jgi:hypothetical protein
MLIALLLTVAPLKLDGCVDSKKESASLHASVGFETPMTKPKSVLKQQLECGGKPVTVFVSEHASADKAIEAANFSGPQLWGGPGPTAEHSDELLLRGTLHVVVSGPGIAAAVKTLALQGFTPWRGDKPAPKTAKGPAFERLGSEVDCKSGKDPLRAWCPAANVAGAGFVAPKGDGVLLGISAPLADSEDVRPVLLQATRVSALAYSGGKLRLTDITPDNEDEKTQLGLVAASVASVLKGSAKKVEVPKGLAGFLPTLKAEAAKSGVPVKDSAKGPAAFTLKFPARAWKVGEVYVVAEDAPDGTWVSVYPIQQ